MLNGRPGIMEANKVSTVCIRTQEWRYMCRSAFPTGGSTLQSMEHDFDIVHRSPWIPTEEKGI